MSEDPDSGHPTPRDFDEDRLSPITPKRPGRSFQALAQETSTPAFPGRQPRLANYFPSNDEDLINLSQHSNKSRERSDLDPGKIRGLIRQEQIHHAADKKEKEELRKLNETIDNERKEVASLRESEKKIADSKKDLEERLNTTVMEKEELEKTIEETNKRITAVEFNLQQRDINLEKAEKMILAKEQLIAEKEQELSAMSTVKMNLEKRIEELDDELSGMSRDLETIKSELKNAIKIKEEKENYVAALEKQVAQTVERWKEEKNEWKEDKRMLQGELEQLLVQHSKEIENITDDRKRLEVDMEEKTKENEAEIRILHKEKEEHIGKISNLEMQLVTAEQRIAQNNQELTGLQETLKRVEIASSAEKAMQVKMESLTQENDSLSKQVAELQERHVDERSAMVAMENNLRTELDEAQREVQRLLKNMAGVKSDLERAERIAAERDAQLHSAQEHVEQLQTEREKLSEENADLRKKSKSYRNEAEQRIDDVDALTREKESNLLKIAELTDTTHRLTAESHRTADLERELRVQSEKLENRQKELEVKEAAWTQQSNELVKAKEELDSLRQRLTQSEAKAKDQSAREVELKKDLVSRAKVVDELTAEKNAFARQQLDDTATMENLRILNATLIKKAEKAAEKIKTEQSIRESSDTRIRHLEEDLKIANVKAARVDELERINAQMTTEIDYLRSELKTRPAASEVTALTARLDVQTAELQQKSSLIARLEEDLNALREKASLARSLENDLRHKEQVLDEQRRLLDEKSQAVLVLDHDKAFIAAEFNNFQTAKENEVAELVDSIRTLQEQLQAQHMLRPPTPSFDLERASVWDAIPHTLRLQLPQDVEQALKALRVNRSDASSLADSQIYTNIAQDRIITSLETIYRQLEPSDNLVNILQQVTRFLYETKGSQVEEVDAVVERFVTGVRQVLETKERKWADRMMRFNEDVAEERRLRSETNRKLADLELDQINCSEENSRLKMNLERSKRTIQSANKEITRHKNDAERLRLELSLLNKQHVHLNAEMNKLKVAVATAFTDLQAAQEQRENSHRTEMELRQQLMDTEAEVQNLRRANLEMDTLAQENAFAAETHESKRTESEQKVQAMTARLDKEVITKRANQDVMRKSMQYMDRLNEYVERLKQRNWQRQRVLDRIHDHLESLESARKNELWNRLEMNICVNRSRQWKKDDASDETGVKEVQQNYAQLIGENQTDMIREVLAERSRSGSSRLLEGRQERNSEQRKERAVTARSSSRRREGKENRPIGH